MPIVKIACAGLGALALAFASAANAEPLKIRGSWVAPVSNWASIWLEKKDLAAHFGKSYVIRKRSLCRYSADDHGDGQQRTRNR